MSDETNILGELQESGLVSPVGSGDAVPGGIGPEAAAKLELNDLETQLSAAHRKVAVSFENGFTHAISAGVLLNEAKSRLKHGEWLPFLERCDIHQRMAARYMRVATTRDELELKLDSESNLPTLSLSAADKLIQKKKKKKARDAKLRDLAEKTEEATDELGVQQYNVILADPPWRFEPYSRDTGMDRAADNHYPTLTVPDIAALDVPDASADDCVLFLWATAPMVEEALAVMAEWGFRYKSQLVWVKDRIGTGYWFRNRHEILLVGTAGSIPAPEMGTQSESVLEWPVGKHSEKPEPIYEMIERMYPHIPKLEMFARQEREGWDAWGNEIGDL